jgi:hypothetical protein
MGTNYFVYYKGDGYCPHCNRGIEEMHVGGQSYGWKFLFQTYETEKIKIRSMNAWIEFIKKNNLLIEDEYGEITTLEKFIEMVKETSKGLSSLEYHGQMTTGDRMSFDMIMKDHFKDEEGNEFSSKWFG